MEFKIQPVLVPKYAERMTINVQVLLGEKAIIRVNFYEADIEFMPLDVKVLYIEGDDYAKWGEDDNYMKDYIFEKLSLPKDIIIS